MDFSARKLLSVMYRSCLLKMDDLKMHDQLGLLARKMAKCNNNVGNKWRKRRPRPLLINKTVLLGGVMIRRFQSLLHYCVRVWNELLGRPEPPFRTGLCSARDVFFVQRPISEVPRPIATKLCHMIGIWLYFIIQVQKFREHSLKKYWGPKTCKNSVDFLQRPTLIANISGTA